MIPIGEPFDPDQNRRDGGNMDNGLGRDHQVPARQACRPALHRRGNPPRR